VASAIKNLEATGWLIVNRDLQHHTYIVNWELGQLDLNRRRNDTGSDSEPAQNVYRTGSETLPEPAQKLSHIDNHDRQPTTDNQLAVPAKRKRKRNAVWDFLTDTRGFGMAAETPTQERRVGALAREISAKLSTLGLSTYDTRWVELVYRAGRWPHHFPDATLTADAYQKHFELLGSPPLKRSKTDTTRQATRDAIEVLTHDS